MIRILAVIALMASPAWAECTLPHGMTPGICSGDDGIISIQNNGPIAVTGTTAPPMAQFCNQGWVMVMVARTWHGGAGLGSTYDTVPKCAPVGDLKDPEEK